LSGLRGRVAIVTGSSGGIGQATAREFARRGVNLVLQYRSGEDRAKRVAEQVSEVGSKAITVRVDFSDSRSVEADVEYMVRRTIDEFGEIDILVNLSGASVKGRWVKPALELTREDFYLPIDVDLYGSFLCCRATAPYMLRQRRGVIVNVSSTPALSGHKRGLAFTVAKAGILGLTKGLAQEWAPSIRVNAVVLGNIDTGWLQELSQEEREEAIAEAPLRRLGRPEEVAKVILFLSSDDSSFITGQTVVVDGGTVMH